MESPTTGGRRLVPNKSFESSINIFDETKRENLPLKDLVQKGRERDDTFNSSLRDQDDTDQPRRAIIKHLSNNESSRTNNLYNTSTSLSSSPLRSPVTYQAKKLAAKELPVYAVDLNCRKMEMTYPNPPKKIHKVSKRLYNPPNYAEHNNSLLHDKETSKNVFDASTILEEELNQTPLSNKPKKAKPQSPASSKQRIMSYSNSL